MREIEEAARKKRDAENAAKQQQALADQLRPARIEHAQRVQREEVFNQSLGGGTKVELALTFVGLGVVAGVCGYLDIHYKLSGVLEYLVMGVGGVLALFSLFYVQDVVRGMIARSRMRSFVASLPGFDGAAYKEAISENRRGAALSVRLEFAGSWPTSKEDVVDAVSTWVPLKSVAWDGDALVLDSDHLETTDRIRGRGSSYKFFTNHAVHKCFAQIAKNVVPKLAAVTPIRQVQFTINGTIEPWDAKL